MKKLSFLLYSLLAVMMLTACNNSDEPIDIITTNVTMNSRTCDGDKVVFSQNNATIEVNYTNATISFNTAYKDIDGVGHALKTPAMTLTPAAGSIYRFNSGSTPLGEITNLNGYIDMETFTVLYSFTLNGSEQVISTSHLIYSYATMTVTNPDNGNNKSYNDFQCVFVLDATGEKCSMVLTKFAPNLNGSIVANQITWEGLTVKPTTTGYDITAHSAESSMRGMYTITDLKFNVSLTKQSRDITGGFKCNDLNIKIEGDLLAPLQTIN